MPARGAPADPGGAPQLRLWQRLLARAPRLRGSGERSGKPGLGERLQRAVLKSEDAAGARPQGGRRPPTFEELEAAKRSDDTERLVGLSLAPIAGLIAILIAAHQLSNNPPATLGGRPNPRHVSVTLTHELELVLLALALVILVTSFLRLRLYTGIATALYGLAVFNLHWWGFGFPFVFVGAWFIVRAYRAQQAARAAAEDLPPPGARGPRANRRYTPPAASPRRPPPDQRRDRRERGAG
ncbi:MAG: hypothetical protein KGJ77_12055 [Acidobacteriota bacterium]|nr:hypothetical protein [Acidobacteriota bacterium]